MKHILEGQEYISISHWGLFPDNEIFMGFIPIKQITLKEAMDIWGEENDKQ